MESNVKKENESNAISNIKIDEYQPNSEEKTKFEQTIDAINKELEQIKNINSIDIQFVPFSQTKYLIKIYYSHSKEYNPLLQKIIFYIEINDKFPEAEPKLTCHSNFCSLYDCRNFIKEVSSYSKQGNFNFYNIITKDIPDLVRHCIDNAKNKIYNVFGEYKLNRLYVINDFVLNANNHLFKAKNKKKETVYLITTEIALLVLQQYKKEDKGKLLLYNELRYFDKFESVCESQDKISVEIIWANQKSKIDKELYHFTKQNFELLKEDVVKKKKSILSQFTHFIENKPENKISDTLNLIKRKEEEYNNSKDTDNKEQMMSDLIHLYQQGIELLNEKGDSRYMEYIQKFKNLVEHQK